MVPLRRKKIIRFSDCVLEQGTITPYILMKMFECLPEDTLITNWGHEYCNACNYIVVYSSNFEEIKDGQVLPEILLKITHDKGYTRVETVENRHE